MRGNPDTVASRLSPGDFEAVTRDPDNPRRFRPDFDPGDHLHPNNAGYQAMANAVDLSIFTGQRK